MAENTTKAENTSESQHSNNAVLPALKIMALNLKNYTTDGYSLGDALLLAKHEQELRELGWTKSQIEELSPNFYCR